MLKVGSEAEESFHVDGGTYGMVVEEWHHHCCKRRRMVDAVLPRFFSLTFLRVDGSGSRSSLTHACCVVWGGLARPWVRVHVRRRRLLQSSGGSVLWAGAGMLWLLDWKLCRSLRGVESQSRP